MGLYFGRVKVLNVIRWMPIGSGEEALMVDANSLSDVFIPCHKLDFELLFPGLL